jgi:hypothetical protein
MELIRIPFGRGVDGDLCCVRHVFGRLRLNADEPNPGKTRGSRMFWETNDWGNRQRSLKICRILAEDEIKY